MLNQYFKTGRWHRIGVLITLLVGAFGIGMAQQEGTTRSLVARVSLLAGEVSYQRASDSVNDWFDATINLPLEESDQLYSGPSGRVELERQLFGSKLSIGASLRLSTLRRSTTNNHSSLSHSSLSHSSLSHSSLRLIPQ